MVASHFDYIECDTPMKIMANINLQQICAAFLPSHPLSPKYYKVSMNDMYMFSERVYIVKNALLWPCK